MAIPHTPPPVWSIYHTGVRGCSGMVGITTNSPKWPLKALRGGPLTDVFWALNRLDPPFRTTPTRAKGPFEALLEGC